MATKRTNSPKPLSKSLAFSTSLPSVTARSRDHIEVIARGCLIHAGRVLLCRNLKHGYLYLPGGHVEFGEAAAVALAREFVEECNLQIRVGPLALVTEGVFATKKRWHHEVNVVFHVEQLRPAAAKQPASQMSQPPRVISRESEISFDWVELAAVPDIDIRPASAKAWLATLSSGDAPPIEWVSEML